MSVFRSIALGMIKTFVGQILKDPVDLKVEAFNHNGVLETTVAHVPADVVAAVGTMRSLTLRFRAGSRFIDIPIRSTR